MKKLNEQIKLIKNPINELLPWHQFPSQHEEIEFATAHDFEQSKLGDIPIKYCSICDIGYTSVVPSEETAHQLYQNKNSSDFDIVKNNVIDKVKDLFASSLIKKVASGIHVTSILDYSTGNGRYAIAASKLFQTAKVVATDFQPNMPIAIQELNHKNSENHAIEYLHLKNIETNANPLRHQKFDLILLRHVLEHSYHPHALLTQLKKLLKSDSVIYIEVPNLKSGCGKIFKKYWTNYYPPYHIIHYTPKSLLRLLHDVGLTGTIEKAEPPKLGNVLSAMIGVSNDHLFLKLAGALLYPIQLLIERVTNSSTCIYVKAVNQSCTPDHIGR